jgi:catechol O-methyltransferase
LLSSAVLAASTGLLATRVRGSVPRAVLAAGAAAGLAVAGNEAAGKPVPFLRWSFLRMMAGMKHLTREWQVGDGREDALAAYVAEHARRDDIDDVIRVIDEFCHRQSFMMNVGEEKGALLDAALRRAQPNRVLEVGAYCGYSALRLARATGPETQIATVEFSAANAEIARRNLDHAGVGHRVEVVVGSLGDGDTTLRHLRTVSGFTEGALDFVFLDHDKEVYLSDLQLILDQGWLHAGSVVVADNVGFPGAPKYRAYMREREGRTWRTVEHKTHVEYQSLVPDLVLESTYLG